VHLGLCLLSNQLPSEPGVDFEFLNRLFNRGLFVRHFNVSNGHFKAGLAVGDQPPVVGWITAH
jgi:hypothetical protein